MTMFDKLKTWLANSPEPRGSSSTEGYAISFHSKIRTLLRRVGFWQLITHRVYSS